MTLKFSTKKKLVNGYRIRLELRNSNKNYISIYMRITMHITLNFMLYYIPFNLIIIHLGYFTNNLTSI